MKRNRKLRKALALLCSVVALIAISVSATLAYLTDSEAATNVFTVGQVGISLAETKTDEMGNPFAGADPVTRNEYKLIPGHTYTKDPTVSMDANSESAYVRMLVTVNGYHDLLAICQAHNADHVGNVVLLQNFVTGWNPGEWLYEGVKGADVDSPSATYEFRYHKTTEKKEDAYSLEPLFTNIIVPGYMDNLDLEVLDSGEKMFAPYHPYTTDESFGTGFEITVTAHAIQAAGFDTADDAWAAFDAQVSGF